MTGQGPFYRVRFVYSLRPANDVVAGYRAGDVLREANKLDTIIVENLATAATIKSYNLGYTQATVSSRLRLATVTECSSSSCLRPTIIGYQAGARGWSTTLNTTSAVASAAARPLPVDLNGDGMTDLVYPVRATSTSSRWWVTLRFRRGLRRRGRHRLYNVEHHAFAGRQFRWQGPGTAACPAGWVLVRRDLDWHRTWY